jgi:AcrR family transcriptional regulator
MMAGSLSQSRDARVVRTRASLGSALGQLLNEQRLDDISVAGIVALAGVSYSTFFRHYTDKHDLWFDLSSALIDGMNRRIAPLIESHDHCGVAQEICGHVADNRELYRMLLAQGAAGNVREVMVANARALARTQQPRWKSGLPEGLATEFGVHGIIAMLAWWLKEGEAVLASELATAMDQLIIGPLFERTYSVPPAGDGETQRGE